MNTKLDKEIIKQAVDALEKGGVIAYPTETLYGLGADITSPKAVKKVFSLKNRDSSKPLLMAVSDFAMLKKYCEISSEDEGLLKQIWPGPVSVLLPRKKNVPDILVAGGDLVGVRFPDHKIAQAVISGFGRPIVSTSANKSGENPPASTNQVNLPVDFLVPGICKYKKPSTLIDLHKKQVLREGVSHEEVADFLAKTK